MSILTGLPLNLNKPTGVDYFDEQRDIAANMQAINDWAIDVDAHIKNTANVLHALATTIAPGFMSASDKVKLDGIQTEAINQATGDARYLGISAIAADATKLGSYAANNYPRLAIANIFTGIQTFNNTYTDFSSPAGQNVALRLKINGTEKWQLWVDQATSELKIYDSAAGSTRLQFKTDGKINAGVGLQEAGTDLSAKYLGISATAADSSKLGGVAASGYALSHSHPYLSNAGGTLTGSLLVSVAGGSGFYKVNSPLASESGIEWQKDGANLFQLLVGGGSNTQLIFWANGFGNMATFSKTTGVFNAAGLQVGGVNVSLAGHTHAASTITQDASNRFVTDTDKSNWNAMIPQAGGNFSKAFDETLTSGSFLKFSGTLDASQGSTIRYASVLNADGSLIAHSSWKLTESNSGISALNAHWNISGTGNIGNVGLFTARINSYLVGTTDNFYNIRSLGPTDNSSGQSVYTNYYGVYIGQLKAASGTLVTTGWGLYQAGAYDRNFLNGVTTIGTSTDDATGAKLQVSGSISESGTLLSSKYLALAGGTLTGALRLTLTGNQIKFGAAVNQGTLGATNTNSMLAWGADFDGANWTARQTGFAGVQTAYDGTIRFYGNTGLTSGNTFTITELGRFSSTGLNLAVGGLSVGGTSVVDSNRNATFTSISEGGTTLSSKYLLTSFPNTAAGLSLAAGDSARFYLAITGTRADAAANRVFSIERSDTWAPLMYIMSDGSANFSVLKEGGTALSSKYLALAGGTITGTIAQGTNAAFSGNWSFAKYTTSVSYADQAIEVREANYAGAQTGAWSEAPAIAFHWSGRVASQITMDSSGCICIRDNPGTGWTPIRAGGYYIGDTQFIDSTPKLFNLVSVDATTLKEGGTALSSKYLGIKTSVEEANLDTDRDLGVYVSNHTGYSNMLLELKTSGGSSRRVQMFFNYADEIYFRVARDSYTNFDSVAWNGKRIWHSGNFTPANKLDTTGTAADSSKLGGVAAASYLQKTGQSGLGLLTQWDGSHTDGHAGTNHAFKIDSYQTDGFMRAAYMTSGDGQYKPTLWFNHPAAMAITYGQFIRSYVGTEANPRFAIFADGGMNWGAGSTAVDVNLYRSAANVLKTDDTFNAVGGLQENGTALSSKYLQLSGGTMTGPILARDADGPFLKTNGDHWLGFDLTGSASSRIILEITQARKQAARSVVFDLEDTTDWSHLWQVYSNGDMESQGYVSANSIVVAGTTVINSNRGAIFASVGTTLTDRDVVNTHQVSGFGGGASNRSIVIQQILNASTSNQFLFLNGNLGSTAAVGTPTFTSSLAKSFAVWSDDSYGYLSGAPSGTDQAVVHALKWDHLGNVTTAGGLSLSTTADQLKIGGADKGLLAYTASGELLGTNLWNGLRSINGQIVAGATAVAGIQLKDDKIYFRRQTTTVGAAGAPNLCGYFDNTGLHITDSFYISSNCVIDSSRNITAYTLKIGLNQCIDENRNGTFNTISLYGTPTGATHAVSKSYVDGTFSHADCSWTTNIENGYQKLPSGLIMQWGTTTQSSIAANTNTTFTVTFPTTFPAKCMIVYAIGCGVSAPNVWAQDTTSGSSSGATFSVMSPTAQNAFVRWIAFGY